MAKAATRPEDGFDITAFPVFEQTERGALYERSNYPGCKHAGKEQQHRKRIAWENGTKTEESRESMNDITLAYSISIHKSQGSEYDCCIIPLLSDQICRLFQKNLLYTGITRAKKKIILVCDGKKALNYCISNNRETRRNTLLMQRIRIKTNKAADV